MLVRQAPGDVGEQPVAVQRLDLDRHQERAQRRRRPLDLDDPLGDLEQLGGVRAVGAVDRDAGTAGDEAEDRVAGHRGAALGQLDQQVVGALDHDAGRRAAARAPAAAPGDDAVLAELVGDRVLAALGDGELVDHGLRADRALADRGVQGVDVGELEVGRDRGEVLDGQQALQRETGLAELAGQRLLAVLDRLLAALAGEVVADLAAGPRAADEGQPVAARTGVLGLGGEDLDDVAVVRARTPAARACR